MVIYSMSTEQEPRSLHRRSLFCTHSQNRAFVSPSRPSSYEGCFAALLPRAAVRGTDSIIRKPFPCHSLAPSIEGYESSRESIPNRVQILTSFPLSPLFLTLTTDVPACPNRRDVTPLESIANFAKSFGSHSYEKCARKSFRTHSYEIIGLKVPPNHTLTENPGGRVISFPFRYNSRMPRRGSSNHCHPEANGRGSLQDLTASFRHVCRLAGSTTLRHSSHGSRTTNHESRVTLK
jgi:hypothetical protein